MYICVSEMERAQGSPDSLVLTKQARLASHQGTVSLSPALRLQHMHATTPGSFYMCSGEHTWILLPTSQGLYRKSHPPQPCHLLSLCAYGLLRAWLPLLCRSERKQVKYCWKGISQPSLCPSPLPHTSQMATLKSVKWYKPVL